MASEANYAKYYQLIVTNIRQGIQAAGQTPQVKFDWNCGTGVDHSDSSHPGSNYSSAALPGYPSSPSQTNAFTTYKNTFRLAPIGTLP